MHLLNLIPKFFYDVPDKGSGGGPAPELTKDDIIDFLDDDTDDDNDDDAVDDDVDDLEDDDDKGNKLDKKDKKDDKKKDDDKEDEDYELAELEDDLKEPTEEDLELVTPVRRAEILKKYPTLFKDFPYLEKAYYREQQFTEVFPTIGDAKEANEKASTLDKFEADLMKGDPSFVLQAVKNEDARAFNKLVDNYLPTLNKVDNRAYLHVVGNLVKDTIASMVREAKASSNDTLRNAALILNQYAFGSSDYTPPSPLDDGKDDEENPEAKKLQDDRLAFKKEKFETANNELNGKVNNQFRSTIEQHIDPRKSMTDYVRRNAVREASEMLGEYIKQDTRFATIIDKLWEHADKNNYSRESIEKIRSAFLSKAKTLLPSVIKKARSEALKGMGKRVVKDKEDDEDDIDIKVKNDRNRSKDKTDKPRSKTNSGQIPKGMSTLDFLMSDD